MNTLQQLAGFALPIVQAPMAGVQDTAPAVAVCNGGGLGSLHCAMLGSDAPRDEVKAIAAQTSKPFNVNFFCHTQPKPDTELEAAWRTALAPYYHEFEIDPGSVPAGPGRAPFGAVVANVLGPFRPGVVSFHLACRQRSCWRRYAREGAKIFSSATTVEEARWLEAQGVDVIIAQGLEAGNWPRDGKQGAGKLMRFPQ